MSKKDLNENLEDLGFAKASDDSQNEQDLAQENGELKLAVANLTADLQRQRADFENYRKRVDGDLKFAKNSGEQNFAKKVLPLLDTFDAIFASATPELRETEFGKGLELAEKNFAKLLGEMRLSKLEIAEGADFDHEKMDAVASEGDEGKVSQVLRAGYIYDGQIIRPAMVKVK